MDKSEKQLAKKLMANYKDPSKNPINFSREDQLILEHWKAKKILNEDAFIDVSSMSSPQKEYLLGQGYPFTSFGDDEFKKNWYFIIRDSAGITILRDILTFIAFGLSLYTVISNAINKRSSLTEVYNGESGTLVLLKGPTFKKEMIRKEIEFYNLT